MTTNTHPLGITVEFDQDNDEPCPVCGGPHFDHELGDTFDHDPDPWTWGYPDQHHQHDTREEAAGER